jgi:hypothetical protein
MAFVGLIGNHEMKIGVTDLSSKKDGKVLAHTVF